MEADKVKKMAVLGAGVMGHGIAQLAAVAGYDVAVRDIAQEFLDKAEAGVKNSLSRFVSRGRMSQEDMDAALARIRFTLDLDEAVKTFEPWFGLEEFGDSNINFWLWVQANDRIASFRMRSELIKRLKARLDREGITINYPVRTTYLHWPEGTQPPLPPDSSGAGGEGEG